MAERVRCEECNRDFPSSDALSMHNAAKHSNMGNNKKSKKSMIIIAIIAIILIGGFWFYNSSGKGTTGNVINGNTQQENNAPNPSANEEIQKITLSMKGNYYPNTINVKSGTPVEITLDSSVRGCYRSFKIPELKVSKYSSNPSDTIKFTPNKKGNFRFQCSMAMGTGTIIVE